MKRLALVALAGLFIPVIVPSFADAHTRMLYPPPRTSNPGIKTGPCGSDAQTTPTELVIGEMVTLQWEETIDHTGHYMWGLDANGGEDQLDFDANVWVDQFPDVQGQPLPHPYETQIPVPDQPCDPCVLQLLQFMSGSNSFYFACADVRIVAVASTPTPTPGGNPGGGNVETGCGCDLRGAGAPIGSMLLVLALGAGLLAVRRRTL